MDVQRGKVHHAAARWSKLHLSGNKMKSKIIVIVVIIAAIALFFTFGGQKYLNFATLKAQIGEVQTYATQNPLLAAGAFLLIYIAVTALSLPGAAILTLAGGAIFGLLQGTILVSFASSIGATLAMLVSRFLLRDWVQGKFGDKLKPINDGVAKEGAFYLFALRLVPAFPFFIVNLVMGLTPIKAWTFYWVSQLGMLAGTLVYVNAGTQLAKLDSLKGILSPQIIGAFVLLGVFPIIAKKLIGLVRKPTAAAE
jgi:uncharacterized membrane protein YdjX (TVP38/TMEM64 family)